MADGLRQLLLAFGRARKAFSELAKRTLDIAARLPAYAAGSAPSDLAAAFKAAAKELGARPRVEHARGRSDSGSPLAVVVVAGASGRGKSALLNDLYRSTKIPAADYAARVAEAATAAGARPAVLLYTPSPQEQWAPLAPKLEPNDVHAGMDVEVYVPLDGTWVPGALQSKAVGFLRLMTHKLRACRTRAGGAHAQRRDGGAHGRVPAAARR